LGVEERRTPVGRAETTRKGAGEEEGVADDDFGNDTRKRERGEEGRERRDQDRRNTQKLGGEGTPIDVGAGGVRGSDERGHRRAEETHNRVPTQFKATQLDVAIAVWANAISARGAQPNLSILLLNNASEQHY
jgi:hypothetical protein